MANLFNTYIFGQFILPPQLVLQILSQSSICIQHLNSISINDADIYYALISLDHNKAVRLHEIGPRVLRSCAAAITKPFLHLFSISIQYEVTPIGERYTTNSCFQIW